MSVGNDENDRTLAEEYARRKVHITVVTFLHKRVFQTNALARTWYKPRVLERCHGGTRWAHGYGEQGTQVWVIDTRRGGGTSG